MTTELELSLSEPLIRPLVPEQFRASIDILWRLDERFMALSLAGREPALRQIRLVWWRDALAALDDPQARVPDEPLLQDIAAHLLPGISGAALADHADMRLAVLGSDWADDDVMAAGRSLFSLTAQAMLLDGAASGGAIFALTRAGLAIDDAAVRQRLLSAATAAAPVQRQPRALAALDQLAQRIARFGGRRNRVREQALILRVGLFGR